MARGAIGREVVFGFEKATTWGTAVAIGAGDGMYVLERGLSFAKEQLPDESAGYPWLATVDTGAEVVTGGPPMFLRFDNAPCMKFLAMAVGNYSFQDEVTPGEGDYLHKLALATHNNGIFGTIAWKHDEAGASADDTWEVTSYKPTGFTIEGSGKDPIQLTPIGIGSTMTRSSAVNTTLAAVTVTGAVSRIPFNKLKFEIDDTGAGAYGTQIYPSSFTFTFDRNASPEHLAYASNASMEPEGEGYPTITLSLSFPQYGHHGLGERLVDDWFSGQNQELKISYTGDQIGAGTNEKFEIVFYDLHIADDDPQFSGPGRIPETVNFTVLDPSGANLPFLINVVTDTIIAALWT